VRCRGTQGRCPFTCGVGLYAHQEHGFTVSQPRCRRRRPSLASHLYMCFYAWIVACTRLCTSPRARAASTHGIRESALHENFVVFQSNKGKTRPRCPYRRSQRLRIAGYSDIPIMKGRMEDSSRPSASSVVPPSQGRRQLGSRASCRGERRNQYLLSS